MGWLFCFNMTRRKDMVADRIKIWDTKNSYPENENYIISTCLRHCYRGNAFSGVLWTVRETVTYNKANDEVVETRRWIACDILRYDNKNKCWGYKDLDESVGPNYYSCPLSYLEGLSEPRNDYAKEWREDVRKYHADRKLSSRGVKK